jgi:hypothetical protein
MPPIRPNKGYSTLARYPRYRTERRIKIPGIPVRPVRFQARSLIRRSLLKQDPYWYILHTRGPVRKWIGPDQLEERAWPASLIRGTLPERIIYKYLVQILRFVPDVDFDFQSSLQGGRIDTGGIVADFLFWNLRIVLNPLGPTHYEYIRIQKDNEQIMALGEMGYQVYMIPEETIYDEFLFDETMKKIFGWIHGGGGEDTVPDVDEFGYHSSLQYEELYRRVLELRRLVHMI